MKKAVLILISFLITMGLITLGCSNQGGNIPRPAPIKLDKNNACAICGMIVVDQPGPWAEIFYDKDKMASFCSISDMFIYYLQPDRPSLIRAIYVEEIGDDEKPTGKWIDGESAYYVYGEDIKGHFEHLNAGGQPPMGNTVIPFKDQSKAKDYAAKHNGKIVRIDSVRLEMIGLKE